MMTKQTEKIRRLVFTAVLMAIILLMCVTPIGYLRAGPVSITFLVIPVALGAILFGPVVGLILGTFFGATSFMQCFGLLSFYGVDAFGAACFSITPVGTIVMCFVPRMLFGLLTAYLYRLFRRLFARFDRQNILSFAVSFVVGTVLHTVMFVSAFVIFFRNADLSVALGDQYVLSTKTIVEVIGIFFTTNAVIEAVACGVLGTAVAKALSVFLNKRNLEGR